jgi:hypothetical protein
MVAGSSLAGQYFCISNRRIEANDQDLNYRLHVIDGGGLFSSNANGPSRNYFLRLARRF